jgi:hypothetical protein
MIDATLDFLLGGEDEQVNVLAASISTTATSLSFAHDLNGIVPGAMITVGIEVMRVVETNPTSMTATVLRAQRGSTAASHAAGSVVTVSPRFSRWSVFRALSDEIVSLSGAGLYRMLTTEFTYDPSRLGFDLPGVTSLDSIYSVRYEVPQTREWPLLRPDEYRLERDANTTDFPSGFSLVIYQECYPGRKIRVAYRAGFNRLTSPSDDVEAVTGLPASAHDIPPLGAAIRLQAGHESGRVAYETQPDTRRADEVPVGASNQAAAMWSRIWNRRVDEELRRLSRRYPVRR